MFPRPLKGSVCVPCFVVVAVGARVIVSVNRPAEMKNGVVVYSTVNYLQKEYKILV